MPEIIRDGVVEWQSYHELIVSDELPIQGFAGITYDDLFNRYAESKYGIHHAQQAPRYSGLYAYDPENMLADLGPDVHPVNHMRYTHDEVQVRLMYVQNCLENVGRYEQFDPFEIVSGRLAPLFHDMGECEHEVLKEITGKVIGDLAWNTKTSADEAAETAIRYHLYEELFPDIPTKLLDLAEDAIANQEGTLLREAFATTERIGYYLTAVRAGYLALREKRHRVAGESGRGDHELAMLAGLAKQVTNNHREVLDERSGRFPFAGIVLDQNVRLDRLIHTEL